MTTVQIVSDVYGDWEGLYINGKLFDEGHSLQPIMVLRHTAALGPFEVLETREAKIEGSLPSSIEEVIWA